MPSGDNQPNAPDQLTVSWIPGWYELDQTVVVGQRDSFCFYEQDQIPVVEGRRFFYFQTDGTRRLESEGVVPQELVFANGKYESNFEVRATIKGIYNSVFGEIRGILAVGLDYRVVTANGRAFEIEAEEDPGFVYALGQHLQDQHFIVRLADVERTDEAGPSRRKATTRATQLEEKKKRWTAIRALIEPFELVESVKNQGGVEASRNQKRPRPARQIKDDETVEMGVAASGFSEVTTFSFRQRLRLGLLWPSIRSSFALGDASTPAGTTGRATTCSPGMRKRTSFSGGSTRGIAAPEGCCRAPRILAVPAIQTSLGGVRIAT